MSSQRPPDWYDRAGMQAWAEGMAAATRRRVSLLSLDETELFSLGIGEGDPARFPLEVNGQPAGWLELRPAPDNEALTTQVMKAISTFRSLAEVRNSMADLVRTTARQWRELSLLYRSSDLLRVDQGRPELANHLLEQATGALRSELGLVRQGVGGDAPVHVRSGDDADSLIDVADWGVGLSEGVMVTEPAELVRLGFQGRAPDQPVLVVPLRCRDICFGSLVLAASPKRPLSSEDLKLASLLADQAGKAFDNLQLVDRVRDAERLKRELEVAAEIQSSILPPADTTLEWLDFAGACQPAKWVGGDTFLFDRQSDTAILTGVADVCGHGISSALLMNAFASSIQALSMTQAQPGRLLAITNDLLENRIGATGLFVTAALMRVTSDGELTIASAGHPEVLIARPSGGVELTDCGNLPLGILPGTTYDETVLTLEPGATVVAYSDGVTEAKAPDGTMYGVERLVELLEMKGSETESCAELRRVILDDVRAYRAGREQDDDVTVVALRRTK